MEGKEGTEKQSDRAEGEGKVRSLEHTQYFMYRWCNVEVLHVCK